MYTLSGRLRISIIYNKPSIKLLQVFLQMGKVSVFSQIEGCSGTLVFVHGDISM